MFGARNTKKPSNLSLDFKLMPDYFSIKNKSFFSKTTQLAEGDDYINDGSILPNNQIICTVDVINPKARFLTIFDQETGKTLEKIGAKDIGIPNVTLDEGFIIKGGRFLIFNISDGSLIFRDLGKKDQPTYHVIGQTSDMNYYLNNLLINPFTEQLISVHHHRLNNSSLLKIWDIENRSQFNSKKLNINVCNIVCLDKHTLIMLVEEGHSWEKFHRYKFYRCNLTTLAMEACMFERLNVDYISNLVVDANSLMWIEKSECFSIHKLMRKNLINDKLEILYESKAEKENPNFFKRVLRQDPIKTQKGITSFLLIPEGHALLLENNDVLYFSHQNQFIRTIRVKLTQKFWDINKFLEWDAYQGRIFAFGDLQMANIDLDYQVKYKKEIEKYLISDLSNTIIDYFGFFKSPQARTNDHELSEDILNFKKA